MVHAQVSCVNKRLDFSCIFKSILAIRRGSRVHICSFFYSLSIIFLRNSCLHAKKHLDYHCVCVTLSHIYVCRCAYFEHIAAKNMCLFVRVLQQKRIKATVLLFSENIMFLKAFDMS